MTLIDTQRIIRSICSVWLMQQGLIIVVEQGQVFRVGIIIRHWPVATQLEMTILRGLRLKVMQHAFC